MVRSLVSFVAAWLAVTAQAEARRPICEPEPLLISLPDLSGLPAPAGDGEECRPGRASSNPACYDDPLLPDAGGRVPLRYIQLLVLGIATAVLPRPAARPSGKTEESHRLSSGHARRIERPTRSLPV